MERNTIIDLLFPRYCLSCHQCLIDAEKYLCMFCLSQLPKTYSWANKYNPIKEILSSRVQFKHAYSFLAFEEKGMTQALMHQIKYQDEKDLAFHLGMLFAQEIYFLKEEIHSLLPIPLHKEKKKIRGYNQAEVIAQGMASVFDLPVETSLVHKVKHNVSQTTLGRKDKYDNVHQVYELAEEEAVYEKKSKHYLLVDDVCTTGATIESFANTLTKGGINLISVATLAVVPIL